MTNAPAHRDDRADAREIDCHAHSTASDGSATPTALVAAAHAARLAAIALTDHDTIAGVDEARAEGARLGVRVIPGVELSALAGEREVHVLGLHIEATEKLEEQLVLYRTARRTRAQAIVQRLNVLGVPVTLDAVLRVAGTAAIGRPHIARAMIDGGWVRDLREAFDRFLGAGRPACVPKHRLRVADAIDLIHRAGAIAVLAHPGPEGTRERVESLVALGLDGLEVRHPSHNAEDVARLGALTDFFALVPSGGSDWHGAVDGARTLGAMHVPYEWLVRQDARAAQYRAREYVA